MLHRSRITTIALSTLAVGALTPFSAANASSTTIYVDNTNTHCVTGAGGGSQATPFCTIQAGVDATSPGEVVSIHPGTYHELVVMSHSGTPGAPITLRGESGGAVDLVNSTNVGGSVALTVAQVHDVTVEGLTIDSGGQTAVEAGGGADLTLRGNVMTDDGQWGGTGNPLVRIGNASDVSITQNTLTTSYSITAVSVDAASTPDTISGNTFQGTSNSNGSAISDAAPSSTILGNRIGGSVLLSGQSQSLGIQLLPGADNSTVAANMVTCAEVGISVGASQVAVTNNTVMQNNNTEIGVTGPVHGVTVENNVATVPDNTFYCGHPNYGNIGLTGVSVDSQATGGTTVDHNDVYFPNFVPYHWGTTDYQYTGGNDPFAQFRAQTGQGAHDTSGWAELNAQGVPQPGSAAIDAADPSAPGKPATDFFGVSPFDDLGAAEYVPAPSGGPTPTPTPTPTPSPTPGPGPNPVPGGGTSGQPTVHRIGGSDRYETSRMVSQAQWQTGSANAVVLARGDAAPDALAGVPLAAHMHGPLLLTDPASLAPATRTEIDRVLGGPQAHKTIYILGGDNAVSPTIEAGLRKVGYTVIRYGGNSRYDTALKIAGAFGPTAHVIVATGHDFPDALSAGPLGAAEGAPIVLSDDAVLDPATAAFIAQHQAVDPVGGQAQKAVATLGTVGKTVDRTLAGADRYFTGSAVAAKVAAVLGHAPVTVGIASGTVFPDALTGGAYVANAGGALLLTQPTVLSGPAAGMLSTWHTKLAAVDVFGGGSAVGANTFDMVVKAVNGRVV